MLLGFAFFILINFLSSAEVIYGVDNRHDLYQVSDPLLVKAARASAAMVHQSFIAYDSYHSEIYFTRETLKERKKLCSGERFAEQQAVADCSGFLIAPDLLVTAGHCFMQQSDCDEYHWVFDMAIHRPGETHPRVSPQQIYSCAEVITRQLTFSEDGSTVFQSSVSQSFGSQSFGSSRGRNRTAEPTDPLDRISGHADDYAVIRLNRPVLDREPLKMNLSHRPSLSTEVALVGFPSGMPLKVAANAHIVSLRERFFTATVDAFRGNSGGAVINRMTGEVEGILVRGREDYLKFPDPSHPDNYCRRVNVLSPNTNSAEHVSYISNIAYLFE